LGAGGSFSDTSWPEKDAASAVSLTGGAVRAAVAGGFAAWAVEPPPLAAREIPNAAPKATTTTATPSATSLATSTA
jgi:hypothetical protein